MNKPDTNPKLASQPQMKAVNIISGGIGNYPIKLELVPKRLIVSIYQQQLLGRGSHIPCWIFVTQGMQSLKQREFVLAIRIEDAEDFRKFPKAPLQLFLHLYKTVVEKKRFQIGNVTPLGDKGFMGFAGIGYTHNLINSNEIQLPSSHLTCIFLTKEELVAARMLGLTRVLARMGYESNRYPINPWNEMKRSGIAMQATIKNSQYNGIQSLVLEHCSANLVNGDTVVLILSPLVHALLNRFLKEHASENKLGFITQLFPYHEGALAWLPMKDTVEMNVHPDADGELIAGSFMMLSRGEQSGASMLEDGFNVMLNNENWIAFRNAVVTKQNATFTASVGQMQFSIVWNLAKNTDLVSGLDALTVEATSKSEEGKGLINKLKNLFRR